MSPLVTAINDRKLNREKAPSAFQLFLNVLSDEDQLAVSKALDLIRKDERKGRAKVYSCAWLAEVLTNHGYPVSRTTIRRYMNENTDHRH